MFRRILALLVGASLPLLWSTAAFAHAVVQPGNAPAGEPTQFQVLIPHGCAEGEPPPPPGVEVVNTRLVSVEIPEGVTVESMEDAEGFTSELTDTEVIWSDGDLENGEPGEFFFTATLDGEDGEEITFNVYQECNDDLNYRWTGAPDDATPAPVVAVGDEPAEGHEHNMEDMAEGEEMDAEAMQDMASEEAMDEEAMDEEAMDEEAMDEEAMDEEAMDEEAMDDGGADDAEPSGAVATGGGGTTGGSTTPWLIGGGLSALIAGAVLLLRRGSST